MRMSGKKTNLLGFSIPLSPKGRNITKEINAVKKKIDDENENQIDLNLQIANLQALTPNKRHSR